MKPLDKCWCHTKYHIQPLLLFGKPKRNSIADLNASRPPTFDFEFEQRWDQGPISDQGVDKNQLHPNSASDFFQPLAVHVQTKSKQTVTGLQPSQRKPAEQS